MFPVNELDPVERFFLLLLYAPDHTKNFVQPIRGKTWLQKEMYLTSKLISELESRTEFDPNLMGSYSEIVEELEDEFYISNFVERVDDRIKLSLEGKKLAEAVWIKADEREKKIVAGVKTLLNDMSYWELLGFIYTEYPESAVNSEKRDEVDARRLDVAVSLFQKGKIPLEMAARIGRQTIDQFKTVLAHRGIDPATVEAKSILEDKEILEEIERSRRESESGEIVSWETIRPSP